MASRQQRKLTSSVNAKFALIILSKNLRDVPEIHRRLKSVFCIRSMVLIASKISFSLFALLSCALENPETRVWNFQGTLLAVYMRSKLWKPLYKCRIRNSCSPKLFLHDGYSAPLLKIIEKYFWQSLLFCKVASPKTDRIASVLYQVHVKWKRRHVSTWI